MWEEASMVACSPDAVRTHTLRAGGEIVARFVQQGGTTRVEAGDAVYELARVGFVRPRVVVRPVGSLADVASLVEDPSSGSADITLAGGERFAFDRLSSAGGDCAVSDARGLRVLTMERELRDDGPTAAIRVLAGLNRHTATMLAMLSWHVLMTDLDDPRRPLTMYNGPERRRHPRQQF
jgi:hypothetical protein